MRFALALAVTALVSAPLPCATQSASQVATSDPVADAGALVISGNVRFTVLTPRLIRMEWADDGRFEDRASLVFIQRRLPVPAYRVDRADGWLRIRTDALTLRYREGSGRFGPDNLEVTSNTESPRTRGAPPSPGATARGPLRYAVPFTWRPGMPDTANLQGTTRTLDGARGPVPLEPGLLSRAGWVVVDDSDRPLFDHGDWPWVVQRPDGQRQDLYLFGYGRDYTAALRDFTRVAGRIPLPPRFAFGYWWSRYWAYTDTEFMDLVRQFHTFDVPIDVLVIDMDWHETFELRWSGDSRDQAGQRLGWTGYTWNPTYFPDPDAFLDWTDRQGLKTPLNLHPAAGIQPHEAQYPAMARAMGIDPETERYVPFDIVDKRFADAYFDLVIHPLEAQGVDFWWLDWQQWHETAVPNLTPTWWLNYVFFTDALRQGRRPLIYHRWGGLGNHRYQIGFSGDAYSTWDALAFEPYFTATAANVGYGYWSHDIGGHINGEVSPELYTRWIQFGIFSPILRTHTTKNAAAERRIWAYPPTNFRIMRSAFRLRYALVPWIYTLARNAHDTGVSIVRPMYYAHPFDEEAYTLRGQYMFGDDVIVSPVVDSMPPDTLLAHRRVWLPDGRWIEWFTGSRLAGGRTVERSFALDEIPAYVRAGSILPMAPPMERTDARPVDPLVITAFPGDAGAFRLYEDPGSSPDYDSGGYAWTPIRQTRDADGTIRVRIGPVEGSFPGMLESRGYELRFPLTWPPTSVRWNGRALPMSSDTAAGAWTYDGDRLTAVVRVPASPTDRPVEIAVGQPDRDDSLLDGVPGLLTRLHRAAHILEALWPTDWPPESLLDLEQTGHRISLDPASAEQELHALRDRLPAVLDDVRAMAGDSTIIRRALHHLGG